MEEELSVRVKKKDLIIFESKDPMLKPLYDCLNEKREQLVGATVIDKIVGQAAAFLCVLGQVNAVYTPVASESAKKTLEAQNIRLKAERIIPQIMNRDNSGPCPMEKLASSCKTPQEFYDVLKSRMSGK